MDQYEICYYINKFKFNIYNCKKNNEYFDYKYYVLFAIKFVIFFYLYKLNLNLHDCVK